MIGNNNPLNIRNSAAYNWVGQTGSTRGFCDFQAIEYCRRAGLYLLMRSYRRAGVIRLEDIIKRWAPSSENDTVSYIRFVCETTGFKSTMQLLLDSDFASVLAAMEIIERGVDRSQRPTYYANAKGSYEYLIGYFQIKRV